MIYVTNVTRINEIAVISSNLLTALTIICFVAGAKFFFNNEAKHNFRQITKVGDNKNHASYIRQLKSKLLSYEKDSFIIPSIILFFNFVIRPEI
jgi:hypothetical protein